MDATHTGLIACRLDGRMLHALHDCLDLALMLSPSPGSDCAEHLKDVVPPPSAAGAEVALYPEELQMAHEAAAFAGTHGDGHLTARAACLAAALPCLREASGGLLPAA